MRKKGIGLRLTYPMPVVSDDYPLFAEFNDAMCDAVRLYALKLRENNPLATVTLDYKCESDDASDRFTYTVTSISGSRIIERKAMTFVWADGAIVKRKSGDFQGS